MAIDRIGKGGGVVPAPETGSAAAKGAVERRFEVERPEVGSASAERVGATEGISATPLGRLRAGDIDVNGYVDLKVEEAVGPFVGKLSAGELDAIRSVLRDQMVTDPGLADLVRTATEQTPKLPEE